MPVIEFLERRCLFEDCRLLRSWSLHLSARILLESVDGLASEVSD